ncbi:ribosome maturation factor RimM [Flavobacterium sp. CS20]|jgi:16S rRNA processing protein RimM|uniref:ribosome maturation factor RimM n=1 Tax=Flavobacterium sp. CS20 TaxID=2775246 RepID=UPI001B3A5FC8|nr:ribosome maturation factor RimM [Flavobacterium sp. CS20]QTY26019.1 16S rRNA processing protein RimM [Flavobacterium sp. CS20]
MDKNEHFYLGTISRKFSFKGEVVLQINPELDNFPEHIKSVFVEFQQKRIPYFIEFTKPHKKNSIRLKFEDISTEQDADQLVKHDVYILKSEIELDDEFSLKHLIGFTVYDENDERIGKIINLNTSTPQAFFEIESNQRQILIPVNEDWIVEIDEGQKEIFFELPDGLLDLNA